ncbi:hypothetical protein A9R05_41900 (plasmid) [Burkholderia sp. KK1]|uniref:hypothetical protein n=1 Tax=Burkholderia sp. M701 TaxID=326454 RepID=UPI000979B833|nr:hypothetical protein [Burkholderia sp. M701]AQH05580.1 hypothetical protein A9R05_41900 [Burkholderia sp. KK1]
MTFTFGIPDDIKQLTPEATILAASCKEPLQPVISSNEEFDLDSIFGVAYRFQCPRGIVDTSNRKVYANSERDARELLELVDLVLVNPDEC